MRLRRAGGHLENGEVRFNPKARNLNHESLFGNKGSRADAFQKINNLFFPEKVFNTT
jgi:hypothetical protein